LGGKKGGIKGESMNKPDDEGKDLTKPALSKKSDLIPRDNQGRFLKGRSGNPFGRAKGTLSKIGQLRHDFLKAYKTLGGVRGLVSWARENPNLFYPLALQVPS
jgi:hypothetical protein